MATFGFGVLLCLACPALAFAEDKPIAADTRQEVERIVVTATRTDEPIAEVPAAISVVGREDVQDGRATWSLGESLNRVPGVFVQESGNFAQDTRIHIRGFGTRAAFGVREIRVLVDGLPETQADGQTQLDAVDLGAVDRIEVLRDTASSLYGNAAGGVIQLFTEDGADEPWAATRSTGGSFGFGKFQVKGGGRSGNARVYVSGSHLFLGGYRKQSNAQATIGNIKVGYDLAERTSITALLNVVDAPVADDPGGLTRAQTREKPTQAAVNNVLFDAGEEVQQARIGFVIDHAGPPHELSAYSYFLARDFENRLAFEDQGIVTFERLSPGGGLRYTWDAPVIGVAQQLTVGLDVQHLDDDRRRFDNLEGKRGDLRVEQNETVTSVGPYVRQAVHLTDEIELSGGVRYDSVRFDVDVDFDDSGVSTGSDTRTMDEWSPAGGLRYTPLSWLMLFGKIGTSFQVPTTTELGNPRGGGLNPSVDPQTAVSYELGARYLGKRLSIGSAAFLIEIDDELIPFEDPLSGRTTFRNAGESRRYGVEADWVAEILRGVEWTGAVTWIDAEFRDYAVAGASFDGNEEPGIPSWQVYQELAYRHRSGAFAALEALLVDDYYVDDGNVARARAYELVNLRLGVDYSRGRLRLEPFIGLNNLLDQEYDGTVRLNAFGGRFYEPAPDFNVFGGVVVNIDL
jgi:iron complex outermembrane receptor protein